MIALFLFIWKLKSCSSWFQQILFADLSILTGTIGMRSWIYHSNVGLTLADGFFISI